MLAYFSMPLKPLRVAKGMTQSEVALYVGVSCSVILAYESAVSALTGAGAFCDGCGGTFDAEGVVSYGQFLAVLTRFVEPEKGYVGSFNVLDHWAAPAAIKAASAGWIDDIPINLNAPATYGAFVNLLTKIFAL